MKLPNPELAFVDVEKLRDYCLNSEHPRGRHKARVFAEAMGFTVDHMEELKCGLLLAASLAEAVPGLRDEFGQRYVLESVMNDPIGEASVRSVWIVRAGEEFPRLVTCHVM